ncbi:MAG: alpha/beta hydrolase [Novosphingobium sp.]|nr:alpha/beta hydrolase [Novosphingobium sp.]
MSDRTLHPFCATVVANRKEAGIPEYASLPPEGARALMTSVMAAAPPPTDLPELTAVSNFTIPGPHGDIPVRRYTPLGEAKATIVYFHGGGWVLGDLETGDGICRRWAGWAGVEVLSVDYRLAPEYPFPIPLDECFAGLEWADQNMPHPLFIAGDSAGGNLSAAIAIRARDEGGPDLAGQIVIYGALGLDYETASYREVGDKGWMLSGNDMEYFWGHYLSGDGENGSALAVPLNLKSASGLAPAFICTGDCDVLCDDNLAYADKLREAGVPVELRVDPGMFHGYYSMTSFAEPAKATVDATVRWIGERIAA